MFDFYLKVYRTGLITFCGVGVNVDFDVNGSDGKFGFREYDNGRFKLIDPISRHPNILKGVIIGKKGWGLWIDQWTDGISEGSFREKDVLEEFTKLGIIIPEPLIKEWDNLLIRKMKKRYDSFIKNKS